MTNYRVEDEPDFQINIGRYVSEGKVVPIMFGDTVIAYIPLRDSFEENASPLHTFNGLNGLLKIAQRDLESGAPNKTDLRSTIEKAKKSIEQLRAAFPKFKFED